MTNLFLMDGPITGIEQRELEKEIFDYHQDIARASFADMLHDEDRNKKYELALRAAIRSKHAMGEKAKVLDIGTGTGLLSMMAARNGADSIVACEAFQPMSKCALKIIELNGFKDKITVIPKRSTQLIVGESGDLEEKCNILVTEVFDTELIGEGAISTFSHAHKYLLEENSIVVPDSATIYVQVVECPVVQSWNKVNDICGKDGRALISTPDLIRTCAGAGAVHDIQLSQLSETDFTAITPPLPVLSFDWSGKTPLHDERSNVKIVKSEHDGVAQVIFMWWELKMDSIGHIILSCAPYWAHPERNHLSRAELPWRDHWMQGVYYLPNEMVVKRGEYLQLLSSHEEYTLWFNLKPNSILSVADYKNQMCDCILHSIYSRTRIGQINDVQRTQKFLSLFETYVTNESVILIISQGFYVGLAASKLAKKVYVLETNRFSRMILDEFVEYNNLSNVEIISNLDLVEFYDFSKVNIVLSEPYFGYNIHAWNSISAMYSLKSVLDHLPPDVLILPQKAVIKGVAVHFSDLYKIRSTLGTCEGFVMTPFDELIDVSSNMCDDALQPQPLWEYPGIALSQEVNIAEIDLINIPPEPIDFYGHFMLDDGNEGCNGIALWVEWVFDDLPEHTFSTGPTAPIVVGDKIQWDMNTRQSVSLFPIKHTDKIFYNLRHYFEKEKIIFNIN